MEVRVFVFHSSVPFWQRTEPQSLPPVEWKIIKQTEKSQAGQKHANTTNIRKSSGAAHLVFSLSPPVSNLLPSLSHNAFLSLSLFCLSLSHTHRPQQWVFLLRSSGTGPGGASLPPLTVPCDCAKIRLSQHRNTLPAAPPKKGRRRQRGKKRGQKEMRRAGLTKEPEEDFLLERRDWKWDFSFPKLRKERI